MARHKEFDRDEALQKAMEVFWARGYEGTSIQSLVGRMGINRQSLYDTFGDKHALYLQSLDRYCQLESRKAIELLENSASVKKAVRKLFAGVVEGALCDTQRRGCFAGNAMSELAGRCKATAARTSSNMAAMEGAFYRALLRGTRFLCSTKFFALFWNGCSRTRVGSRGASAGEANHKKGWKTRWEDWKTK